MSWKSGGHGGWMLAPRGLVGPCKLLQAACWDNIGLLAPNLSQRYNMTQRVLTGITTTGTLHLGNYVGAIRPAIAASRQAGVESFYFMADSHALIKCDEPARVARSRLEITATWIAAGLDPERTLIYRQSDIPEIPE